MNEVGEEEEGENLMPLFHFYISEILLIGDFLGYFLITDTYLKDLLFLSKIFKNLKMFWCSVLSLKFYNQKVSSNYF